MRLADLPARIVLSARKEDGHEYRLSYFKAYRLRMTPEQRGHIVEYRKRYYEQNRERLIARALANKRKRRK